MKTNYLHKKQIASPKKRKLTTDNKIQNTHQVPSSHLVLSGLPNDILTIIFTFLYHSNPLNYLNLRRVCRTFNTLLTTQPISSGLDFSKFNPPLRRGGDILLQQLLNLIKPTSILNMYRINTPVINKRFIPTQISDAAIVTIAQNCRNLTHLDLSNCERITGEGLAAVAQHFSKLTSLNLQETNISDEGLSALAHHCPNLTSINLYRTNVTAVGLSALAHHCTDLTSLSLGGRITDTELAAVAQHCSNLTSFYLSMCDLITGEGLKEIFEKCQNLTSLDLNALIDCPEITDAGLEALAQHCRNLTYLNLNCTYTCDIRIQAIAENCRNLTFLDLGETDITDDGLAAIAQHCTNLTYLNVWGCENIYDEDIARIQIALPHCRLAGIDLKKLTNLTSLDLGHYNNITDAGLEHIKSLTNLTDLRLTSANITDAGLEHLKSLTKLRHLDLTECYDITDEGLTQLRNTLPHCNIRA